METVSIFIAWVTAIIIGVLGGSIVYLIIVGKINLEFLISEKDGSASLSRFQFLIFTFVVAMSLFLIVLSSGRFPDISPEILGLLGISGGSYVISKGIQKSGEGGSKAPASRGGGRRGGGQQSS